MAEDRRVNVLLLQLDGKLPNLALMRIAAHHRRQGDHVTLRQAGNETALGSGLWDVPAERVYASLIFERTRPLAERLREIRPDAVLGGTGWDLTTRVEDLGIVTDDLDYEVVPGFAASIGFTQRGCRLRCSFCVVPRKEGKNRAVASLADIWRGPGHQKNLLLLDNDLTGSPEWRRIATEAREGGYRLCVCQGINVRLIGEEDAAALAGLDLYDDSFTRRRIYTAWDNRRDEDRLFEGLERLRAAGVRPDTVMVYMLLGYPPHGDAIDDWLHRRARLREWGARPYPMPFARTREAVGFQRWVIGAYDKRIAWDAWVRAGYSPRRLGVSVDNQGEMFA